MTNDTTLAVRLAETAADIDAAQTLRYRVFYEEGNAAPTPAQERMKRDADLYDLFCDHLLVTETDADGNETILGTYRLLRRSQADAAGSFLTETEFRLCGLKTFPGEILELGRACVAPEARARGIIQLLWSGIADYVKRHKITLMFGCASFPTTDVSEIKEALAYLHHYHRAESAICPVARKDLRIDMDTMDHDAIELRRALSLMPPLLKGYLRLGGVVGEGAVLDSTFGTIDVCLLVETGRLEGRYRSKFFGEQRPAPVVSAPVAAQAAA